MKLIFISGPYRGNIEHNIIVARRASIKLWKRGFAVICPHMNSANMDGECQDNVFLEGDLEIMRRCDAVYFLKDWESSEGSRAEYREAVRLKMELMFEALED